MDSSRGILRSLLLSLLAAGLVLGSLSQAMAEGLEVSVAATSAPTGNPTEVFPTEITLASSPTYLPTPEVRPTHTPTARPRATTCPVPETWDAYLVQPGDTLAGIARSVALPEDLLAQANCLVNRTLQPGTILYLPPVEATAEASPTPRPTARVCGPPPGWIRYTVQRGDTLYRISQLVGASLAELQYANCLGTSTIIVTGDLLFVPVLPPTRPAQGPAEPQPTATQAATEAPAPTATATQPPVQPTTAVPSPEPTAQPTAAPTVFPTEAPVPTDSPTDVPTAVPTPLELPSPEPTPPA